MTAQGKDAALKNAALRLNLRNSKGAACAAALAFVEGVGYADAEAQAALR
jgi:hypothetical protein